MTFHERVRHVVISCATPYKNIFIDSEFLIVSLDFTDWKYYLVSAIPDNFLHLTGVKTHLKANGFFYKCLNGTLEIEDFTIPSEYKGSIRRKIKVLPKLVLGFNNDFVIQEKFIKNKISCALASSDNNLTIGFVKASSKKSEIYPMTLLSGNELDDTKIISNFIILKKNKSDFKFKYIVKGNPDELKTILSNYNELESLIELLY